MSKSKAAHNLSLEMIRSYVSSLDKKALITAITLETLREISKLAEESKSKSPSKKKPTKKPTEKKTATKTTTPTTTTTTTSSAAKKKTATKTKQTKLAVEDRMSPLLDLDTKGMYKGPVGVEGYWRKSEDEEEEEKEEEEKGKRQKTKKVYPWPVAHPRAWAGESEFLQKLEEIQDYATREVVPGLQKSVYKGKEHNVFNPKVLHTLGYYVDRHADERGGRRRLHNIVWNSSLAYYVEHYHVKPSLEFREWVKTWTPPAGVSEDNEDDEKEYEETTDDAKEEEKEEEEEEDTDDAQDKELINILVEIVRRLKNTRRGTSIAVIKKILEDEYRLEVRVAELRTLLKSAVKDGLLQQVNANAFKISTKQ